MYVQLIDKNKRNVLQQRFTPHEQPSLDYYRDKVWWVSDDLEIVVSQHSDYVQPSGFFAPVLKGTEVRIYVDIDMEFMATTDPLYIGKVECMPELDKKQRFFVVTSSGLWVACSEL